MKQEDIYITANRQCYKDDKLTPRVSYVKAEHKPTGITVTVIDKSQIKARDKALEELEKLLTIWEE